MLKKFEDSPSPFYVGCPIYIVTRDGIILEGFKVASRLGELVSLNRPPIEGSEKEGFTIEEDLLKPNWCEGKRQFVGACLTKEKAEQLAIPIIERLRKKREKAERVNNT